MMCFLIVVTCVAGSATDLQIQM